MESLETRNTQKETTLRIPNRLEFSSYIQSQFRLMLLFILTSVGIECGPSGIRKNIKDIPIKEEMGVTTEQKPTERVQIKLKIQELKNN